MGDKLMQEGQSNSRESKHWPVLAAQSRSKDVWRHDLRAPECPGAIVLLLSSHALVVSLESPTQDDTAFLRVILISR
ncbi:hypothetical protein E2C01_088993 [Portunus trituberculatus]|uniref:Uncharacterized protein n=1 Tax=Portunus trituberculatus TaxID=210409 RepID=A0A5B7JLB7_PORTR|nr:hypothetical protein [Portunus trituberculatus]